ncbi:MAG: DUF4390 domain-containing protein [Rhodocyclaceae bacterium]|jgi:hypothetical protein|nr:DUF4390 domain-containing protein [Rhodocyclaceae bacterium]PKO71361.1 MAG: DUF4390 domain-containing protein [Betaproteobacteria bacterium HGW-Betaproteobacteria-14]
MTAFITRCWKSRPEGFGSLARRAALLCLLSLVAAQSARAAEIEVKHAEIVAAEDSYLLDAEFGITLSQRLEEVVSRGVPLYFVAELELTRTRWYWVDEHVAGRRQTWRLAYHALTRQYRLSSGALHQNLATLEEALGVLARLRNWPVADKDALKAGEPYNVALRMKLDLSQLPKPLQVGAIGNKDWNITAEVKRWSYTPLAESTAR